MLIVSIYRLALELSVYSVVWNLLQFQCCCCCCYCIMAATWAKVHDFSSASDLILNFFPTSYVFCFVFQRLAWGKECFSLCCPQEGVCKASEATWVYGGLGGDWKVTHQAHLRHLTPESMCVSEVELLSRSWARHAPMSGKGRVQARGMASE